MNTQFANIATPSEVVDRRSPSPSNSPAHVGMHICLPYSMVEPIRDLLTARCTASRPRLRQSLDRHADRQLQTAEVELVATSARPASPWAEMVNMKVGDVIPIDDRANHHRARWMACLSWNPATASRTDSTR
jgi:flagellar motor switch protein FliM